MKIIHNPDIEHLNEIKKWLINEKKSNNPHKGFFGNFNVILSCFNEKRLFVFLKKEYPIGFACWSYFSCGYVQVDIFEIHPNHRKKGFGKKFYLAIESYFIQKCFFAIKLYCNPSESEYFWKKMKFIKYPYRGYSEHPLTYYKPLIKTNYPALNNSALKNKLELWNLEPNDIENEPPIWIWGLENDFNTIVQPCNINWNLRLTKSGTIVKEAKVKYFDSVSTIYKGDFLFFNISTL